MSLSVSIPRAITSVSPLPFTKSFAEPASVSFFVAGMHVHCFNDAV